MPLQLKRVSHLCGLPPHIECTPAVGHITNTSSDMATLRISTRYGPTGDSRSIAASHICPLCAMQKHPLPRILRKHRRFWIMGTLQHPPCPHSIPVLNANQTLPHWLAPLTRVTLPPSRSPVAYSRIILTSPPFYESRSADVQQVVTEVTP